MTKKLTKNQKYVASMKAKGFRQATVWVPEHSYDDVMFQAKWLCEQEDAHIPFMARSLSTGKMKKCV